MVQQRAIAHLQNINTQTVLHLLKSSVCMEVKPLHAPYIHISVSYNVFIDTEWYCTRIVVFVCLMNAIAYRNQVIIQITARGFPSHIEIIFSLFSYFRKVNVLHHSKQKVHNTI